MSEASKLFKTLCDFKHKANTSKSPEKSLTDYCTNVLGGIERVHFDFKEKSDPRNPLLDDTDKKNLARAISGFANGSGGVLIWGLKDDTIDPKPINSVSVFIVQLLQMCHNVTDPAVPGVDADFLPSDSNSRSGFGLVFVPESDLPPHRAILKCKATQNHYYVRSGSSFRVATHAQLADMFGRRPRPDLAINLDVKVRDQGKELSITIALENNGRGLARYPFLSLEVSRPFGLSEYGIDGNGHFGLPLVDKEGGFRVEHRTLYSSMKFGSQDGFVIHSGMSHPVTKIGAQFSPGDRREMRDLLIRYGVAAEGIPLQIKELVITESELIKLGQK
jgi:hypothetical protein